MAQDHRPLKFVELPSGLSRHGSGDLHGSRPAPVSPPAGARSSPGALPGHDPMPPGAPRTAKILCRRADTSLREVSCEVSLSTPAISPTGRLTDRFTPDCQGQVSLDGGGGDLGEELTDFPVRLNELQTPPMDQAQVLAWYEERSGLNGRYRVIGCLRARSWVARGRTTYREAGDFAYLRYTRYQYSPYLFEALTQSVYFAIVAMDPSERRSCFSSRSGRLSFPAPPGWGTDNRGGPPAGEGRDRPNLARIGLDDQGRPARTLGYAAALGFGVSYTPGHGLRARRGLRGGAGVRLF